MLPSIKDLWLHLSLPEMKNTKYLGEAIIYLDMVIVQPLVELAINDQDNKQNEHGDDRNGYNPICSHPTPTSVPQSKKSIQG